MEIAPIRLINKSERERLLDVVRRALQVWQNDWFAAPQAPVLTWVDDSTVNFSANREWKSFKNNDNATVSIGLPNDWTSKSRQWLVGEDGASVSTGWMAAAIGDQLIRSLAMLLLNKGETPSDKSGAVMEVKSDAIQTEPKKGSARVQCTLEDGSAMSVYLSSTLVDVYVADVVTPARDIPLSQTVDAMADQRIVLRTVLGEAELTLQELRTLGVGDVITLERKVEDPLPLRLPDNTTVFAGFLGTKGDRKAVQLVAVEESFS